MSKHFKFRRDYFRSPIKHVSQHFTSIRDKNREKLSGPHFSKKKLQGRQPIGEKVSKLKNWL